MNIVCVSTLDWIELHLHRFCDMALRSMPSANLYCAVVVNSIPQKALTLPTWMRCFKGLKVVTRPDGLDGLVAFDSIRTNLWEWFNLESAMYLDIDADVVGDLGEAETKVPAGLGLVRDPIVAYDRQQLEQSYGVTLNPPFNIGTCFAHRDAMTFVRAQLEDMLWGVKLSWIRTYGDLRGTLAWNVAIAKYRATGGSVTELPYGYSTLFYDVANHLSDLKVVQFSGLTKKLRNHLDYSDLPTCIKLVKGV